MPPKKLKPLSKKVCDNQPTMANKKQHIIQELEAIAPLLSQLKKPPPSQLGELPEGYFENFEEKLQEKIGYIHELEETAPLLLTLKKPVEEQLGALSEDYFLDFEQRLAPKLAELDGVEEASSLLHTLKKNADEQLGELPEGYFENFEQQLQAKLTTEKRRGAVAEMPIKPKLRRIRPSYVMGIAASFLFLMVSTIWLFRGKSTASPFDYQLMVNMNIDKGMHEIELAAANTYLMEHIDALETEDIIESLDAVDVIELSDITPMIMLPPLDSVPPTNSMNTGEATETATNKTKPTLLPQKNAEGSLTEELEDEMVEDTDLDDLFGKINDSDLDALETALLKPKKKEEK